MARGKLAVLILTHGRADNMLTDKTLRRHGFTGPIYYVVDDEDKTQSRYHQKYGDAVIVFNKQRYVEATDVANNWDDRRVVVYARNAAFDIAEALGLEYFIVLDDDYRTFDWRVNSWGQFIDKPIKNLDAVFGVLVEFYAATPFVTIAMAQSGDFIGGVSSTMMRNPTIHRKAMNSFICSPGRRFQFVGHLNEDTNAYVALGARGVLFGTIPLVALKQVRTQHNPGGLTDAYLALGTYIKSFYTVMMAPSACTVAMMGGKNRRLHHRVDWGSAVPLILSDSSGAGVVPKIVGRA